MFLCYVFYVRMKVVMFQFWFQSAKDAESICFPLLIEKGLGSSIFLINNSKPILPIKGILYYSSLKSVYFFSFMVIWSSCSCFLLVACFFVRVNHWVNSQFLISWKWKELGRFILPLRFFQKGSGEIYFDPHRRIEKRTRSEDLTGTPDNGLLLSNFIGA